MRAFFALLGLALCLLMPDMAAAQSINSISSGVPDPRILNLHEKVDHLFKRGEIGRAYFIYRNELVPLGDKYAQYMVGYMHLTGLAVEQDRVAASAWYRLAAERGTPEFVALRDRLLAELTDQQRKNSNGLYRELHLEYCDLAIMLTSIQQLHAEAIKLRDQLQHDPTRTDYYFRVRHEITLQKKMLAKLGDFPDMEADPGQFGIEEIEQLVAKHIADTID